MGRMVAVLRLFLLASVMVQESVSFRSSISISNNRRCLLSRTTTTVTTTSLRALTEDDDNDGNNDDDDDIIIAEQEQLFKIVTCMSTSCCRKRDALGMDSLSTFSAMYSRASSSKSKVQIEEGPCVGSCQDGPCIAIEHEDFFGFVSLEGMTDNEFSKKAFLNIVTEEDADRVWSSVENAVKMMAEAADDDDDDDDED